MPADDIYVCICRYDTGSVPHIYRVPAGERPWTKDTTVVAGPLHSWDELAEALERARNG